MKTIKTQIPEKSFRTFAFYASQYGLSVSRLMEAEAYSQAATLTDAPFGTLKWIDDCHCDEDLREITLTFSATVFSLLRQVSHLLRRPLNELLQDLLTVGGDTLGGCVGEAMRKERMGKDPELKDWAIRTIEFTERARANLPPKEFFRHGDDQVETDCWGWFDLTPPKKTRTTTR